MPDANNAHLAFKEIVIGVLRPGNVDLQTISLDQPTHKYEITTRFINCKLFLSLSKMEYISPSSYGAHGTTPERHFRCEEDYRERKESRNRRTCLRFRDEVKAEILKHRGSNAVGVVVSFVVNIEAHRAR